MRSFTRRHSHQIQIFSSKCTFEKKNGTFFSPVLKDVPSRTKVCLAPARQTFLHASLPHFPHPNHLNHSNHPHPNVGPRGLSFLKYICRRIGFQFVFSFHRVRLVFGISIESRILSTSLYF